MAAHGGGWSGLSRLLVAFRRRVLLATIPFALLVNSSQTVLTLTVEPDGSAHRQVSVAAAPYFRDQVPRWTGDVRTEAAWDRNWTENRESDLIYSRDARVAALPQSGETGALTISDVFQNPLSIYTTYRWRENIGYSYLYESDVIAAQAAGKALTYQITMPGPVTNASVTPAMGSSTETEGRKVTFQLDASQGQQTVEVEAKRIRWGYLLVLAYILAYVAYCVTRLVRHWLHIQPRKI